MISAQSLSFTYGSSTIFDEISFSVSKNSKVGLVGPNGVGKTTLFNLIIGRELPDSGKIDIVGEVGYVPQEVKVDLDLANSKVMRDYLDPKNEKQDYELIKMLNGLELGGLQLTSSPKNLSGGQKTKLALSRALLLEPEILLLDEPINFLDVLSQRIILEVLKEYKGTMIIVSHTEEFIDELKPDKVLMLPENEIKYWSLDLIEKVSEV